jgi:hypothetical protein
LLGDRGYGYGYDSVIPFIKREGSKNPDKIKHLTEEKVIYKKKIKVENYFAWIKKYYHL